MEAINNSTQQWVAENMPSIEAFAGLKAGIGDQNTLAAKLRDEVETPAILDEGIAHLTDMQRISFTTMREASEAIPYDEILKRYDYALKWMSALAIRMERAEAGEPVGTERIRSDAEIVAAYLPAIAERLSEISQAQIEELRERERRNLAGEQIAASRVFAKIEEVLNVVGIWPIPELLPAEERNTRRVEDEFDIIDNFPEDKATLERQERIVADVRHRYMGRTNGASEFLALILADAPKEAWTRETLSRYIYGDEYEQDPIRMNSRVSSLIANYEGRERGKRRVMIIGEVLKEFGLVLQRGKRRRINRATGKQVGHSYVLFRAVTPEDALRSERIVRGVDEDDYVDADWETIDPQPQTE